MTFTGLNPFGVREVSKPRDSETCRRHLCLNPFGVREVSKLEEKKQQIVELSLNPFGVREVSKPQLSKPYSLHSVLIPLESGKFLNTWRR